MKTQTKIENSKLGLFVIAGMAFLILMLYMIGKNRNLFGDTFTIHAVMSNVNGLVKGNNVRFKGIDVGTVRSIRISSDTSILVDLTLDKEIKPYVRRNAIASIGTDGLMGNKLVNINSRTGASQPIREGDTIRSMHAVETDEMLRTLNTTNNNIERITENLYDITQRLNSNNSLWTILSDTSIAQDLRQAIAGFRKAGANTAHLSSTADAAIKRWEDSDGLVSHLFSDTTLSSDLGKAIKELHIAAASSSAAMNDVKSTISMIKEGQGMAGLLLSDSVFREKLNNSAINIEAGTDKFNENMEALKSNFLFRRYFRKLEKNQRQEAQTKND